MDSRGTELSDDAAGTAYGSTDILKSKDVVAADAISGSLEAEKASKKPSGNDNNDEKSVMKAAEVIKKSPGVVRMEALSRCSNIYERSFLYFSIFLVGYTYSLGGTVQYTMQSTATSALGKSALQSSVNVISSVIAAAAQPTAAKISDVFGRTELVIVGIVFYVLGSIVLASASNIAAISGGKVLYQIGYTVLSIIMELLIADFTTVRARVVFSYLPAIPFIINTWISGNVNAAILGKHNEIIWMWRWGFGVWCIILPVMCLPLLSILFWLQIKANRRGYLKGQHSLFEQRKSFGSFCKEIFWLLDVPGIVLAVGVFILVLFPLTLAGGVHAQWKKAKIIAPIVIGFCLIPVFILYELWAPHPFVPFRKMGHRYILAPLGIGVMLNFIWTMQAAYLYNMLLVTYNFSVTAGSRILSLYSFCSVISGVITGMFIYYTRRVKIYILVGVCLFMVAFGLLIRFRGGESDRSGVIGGEVILGIAGGMFPYPAQAVIQAFVPHENMGVMTGLYLSLYNIGSAFGSTVSGAVYTQVLPNELAKHIPGNNATMVSLAYGNPIGFITQHPMGTPVREGMIVAYKNVQKLLCTTGICLIVIQIVCAISLPNPILTDRRSLVEEDQETSSYDDKWFTKIENALSLPPRKRVRSDNKWKRFLDELW